MKGILTFSLLSLAALALPSSAGVMLVGAPAGEPSNEQMLGNGAAPLLLRPGEQALLSLKVDEAFDVVSMTAMPTFHPNLKLLGVESQFEGQAALCNDANGGCSFTFLSGATTMSPDELLLTWTVEVDPNTPLDSELIFDPNFAMTADFLSEEAPLRIANASVRVVPLPGAVWAMLSALALVGLHGGARGRKLVTNQRVRHANGKQRY